MMWTRGRRCLHSQITQRYNKSTKKLKLTNIMEVALNILQVLMEDEKECMKSIRHSTFKSYL